MLKIKHFFKSQKTKIIWVVVTFLLGGLGALLAGNFDVYESYEKPPLSPPAILFPIVWTLLYILIGIAAGIVADSRDVDRTSALKLYCLQLLVNIIWPIIFFRFEALRFALFWLLLLLLTVAVTIKSFFRITKLSAYLMIPYFVWCLFAFYLNFGIVVLN